MNPESHSPYAYGNLTEKDLLANNGAIVAWAIDHATFHELPKEAITAKVLLQEATNDTVKGHRLIHLLAMPVIGPPASMVKHPPLKHIPQEVFTHELLSTRTDSGETVYHLLAQSYVLECIPKELINKDSLLLETPDKRTVLHSVAVNIPELIPKEITLKEMLIRDKNNFTPLHGYACSSKWSDIPKEFLTKDSVEIEDREGKTPTDYILDEFGFDVAYREKGTDHKRISKVKHVLSLVSQDFLNKRTKLENHTITKLIEQELNKRKILKEINKTEQSLEI